MANKRKRSSGTAAVSEVSSSNQRTSGHLPSHVATAEPQPPRRPTRVRPSTDARTNPNANPEIVDGVLSLRSSPDGGESTGPTPAPRPRKPKSRAHLDGPAAPQTTSAEPHATTEVNSILCAPAQAHVHEHHGRARGPGGLGQRDTAATPGPASTTAAVDLPDHQPGKNRRRRTALQHVKVDSAEDGNLAIDHKITPSSGHALRDNVGVDFDPEAEAGPEEGQEEQEVSEALSRAPPVNSDYLPLPWKGRLGYACLNTYLRNANPPVFSSRTCRIASILEHRHPLKDPSQPEHPTKNRPDKEQPADVGRGQRYVEELGLANARDVVKMLRWNDKYGIKFMRLSSEMFPFASHDEYGYQLAPFAADTLAEVGAVVAELGHRVTTHPGQFTQLGSPRKHVIDASIRDLAYHDEMLSLLKLPPQQDRDAVMILHLGGAFGDKEAAIDRFRANYAKLPQSVKDRLVLENDDVVYSVHEILPLCQELNIPCVLDFHHHNILFDSTKIREGTKDIVDLFPAILETWTRKGKTPKMHYSEPCPDAITARSRRKHSPRVMTLPPCPDTMDLMIEAKDKEQAVFELMRTFKLPGYDLFNDITPHVRQDENKPFKPRPKKAAKKGKKKKADDVEDPDVKIEEIEEEKPPPPVPIEEVGMGGPEGRVYWPPGMEEWLRPPKRIVKKKEEGNVATPAKKKRKTAVAPEEVEDAPMLNGNMKSNRAPDDATPAKKGAPKRAASSAKRKAQKADPTPEPSDEDSSPLSDYGEEEEDDDDNDGDQGTANAAVAKPAGPTRQRSGRVTQKVCYNEEKVE